MYTRLLFILASVLVLGLLLGSFVLYTIFGLGGDRSEVREVSGFTAVNFPSVGEMTIIQGETEGLTIEASRNLLSRIRSTVRNGTLTISIDNRFSFLFPFRLLQRPQGIRYTLNVRNLEALDLSGAGVVQAEQLSADRLMLTESGAGRITIGNLAANDLTVTISGAGAVELAGQVTNQTVRLSGLGKYEATDLESQAAQVDLSGAGSATLWVRDNLEATISGAGSIDYYGSPQTDTSSSGVGSVNSLGEK